MHYTSFCFTCRKDLPLLGRRHRLVASAHGGDLVLADASPLHVVRVLNPFTGATTRFAAALPSENGLDDHVIRYAATGEQGSVASILLPEANQAIETRSLAVEITNSSRSNPAFRCFVVESAGEVLLILKLHTKILQIYKLNTEGDQGHFLDEVKSLPSGRALFVGDTRCLSIDAHKFDYIDSNCIYHYHHQEFDNGDTSADIYMYDLESEQTVKIYDGSAIYCLNPVFLSFGDTPPFSPIHLFCSYAQEARRFELAWERSLEEIDQISADLIAPFEFSLEDLEDEFYC